jgi:hypothetical protein
VFSFAGDVVQTETGTPPRRSQLEYNSVAVREPCWALCDADARGAGARVRPTKSSRVRYNRVRAFHDERHDSSNGPDIIIADFNNIGNNRLARTVL